MPNSIPALFTIGYEGKTIEKFVGELKDAAVRKVVDVRELPISRKKGFSKNALAVALETAGIEYVHVREAGNPFRAEKGNIKECLRKYAEFISTRRDIVERLATTAGDRSALLCFEAKACDCHRGTLVRELEALRDQRVVNL